MMNLKTLALAGVFAVGSTLALQAATVKDLGGGVSCTYGGDDDAGVSISTDCTQASPLGNGGNTTLVEMNGQSLFSIDDWSFADKIDNIDEGITLGDFFKITFTDFVIENGKTEAKAGTWELLAGFSFAPGESYAIALKSATSSFVYLLDPAFSSGTWSTVDLGGKAISNMTLFGTVAPIPLPAAGFLMLGALGALGVAARRRKA